MTLHVVNKKKQQLLSNGLILMSRDFHACWLKKKEGFMRGVKKFRQSGKY